MAKVDDRDLKDLIVKVLKDAAKGKSKDKTPGFLTAYQILNRLDPGPRQALEKAYGPKSGEDAGRHFSPASRIAQVAASLPPTEVEQAYFDTRGLEFSVVAAGVTAGFPLCAIFRVKGKRTAAKSAP